MVTPRRKFPVGRLVARLKVAPTMPSKEVYVVGMELIALPKRAAMMGVATMVFVSSMAQSVNLAAKKGVLALPKNEVFIPSMAQSVNLAAMKDVQALPKKEVSVPSMAQSVNIAMKKVAPTLP